MNPNTQEAVGDDVDQDCDGHDALGRRLMFNAFGTFSWNHTGYTMASGDGVILGNGTTSSGAVTRNLSSTVPVGRLLAAIDVGSFSGPAGSYCQLSVTTAPTGGGSAVTALWNISAGGTQVSSALAVTQPSRVVTQIRLSCAAGRQMSVDWLSLQNASAILAPARDFQVAWEDIDAPGGGLTTAVVRDGQRATTDMLIVDYASVNQMIPVVPQPAQRASTLGDVTGDGLDDLIWYEVEARVEAQCLYVGDAARFHGTSALADTVFSAVCEHPRLVTPGEWFKVSDYDVDDDSLLDMVVWTAFPLDGGDGPTLDAFGWLGSRLLGDVGTHDLSEFGPFYKVGSLTNWGGAADLDGDGFPELVVSDNNWDSPEYEDAGRMMVIPGFDIPYGDPSKW